VAYNPDKHHRRSIRLKGHDYSDSGIYFITICTYHREEVFGAIVDGTIELNELGKIVVKHWQWLSTQYSYVTLDEWVVMPNHLHGVLAITDTSRRGGSRTAPTNHCCGTPTPNQCCDLPTISNNDRKRKPLGRLIGAFKTVSTKEINQIRNAPNTPIWQRNYYEHIVRDRTSLQYIRHYIRNNPLSWKEDQLHPDNLSKW
jgi:REP element-mobilizing transposase RayT